jgi:hypothetical protein
MKRAKVPMYRKGTRPITMGLTSEELDALTFIVNDMQVKGEAFATEGGAVGMALQAEARRRGFQLAATREATR